MTLDPRQMGLSDQMRKAFVHALAEYGRTGATEDCARVIEALDHCLRVERELGRVEGRDVTV